MKENTPNYWEITGRFVWLDFHCVVLSLLRLPKSQLDHSRQVSRYKTCFSALNELYVTDRVL